MHANTGTPSPTTCTAAVLTKVGHSASKPAVTTNSSWARYKSKSGQNSTGNTSIQPVSSTGMTGTTLAAASGSSNWMGMGPTSNTSQQRLQSSSHQDLHQDGQFKKPAPPVQAQNPAASSQDFTQQLLKFVGLPTNFANQLAPQQKKPVKTVNGGPAQKLASESQVKANFNPVIPKPSAPLPANLVEDIPFSREKNLQTTTRKNTVKTSSQNSKLSGILRNTSSNVNSTKRMSLKDYKSKDDATRTAVNKSLVKSVTSPSSQPLLPDKDKDGFVIPNSASATSHSKGLIDNQAVKVNLSASETTPSTVETSPDSPESLVIAEEDVNNLQIVDDLDTSIDDELVIDESADFDIIDTNPKGHDAINTNSERRDLQHNFDGKEDEPAYRPKSKADIHEIAMELDDLCNSLDTDGTLQMDHKVRKKLKKLLRRQKKREAKARMQSKQSGYIEEMTLDIDDQNNEIDDDDENDLQIDLDYPASPEAHAENEQEEKMADDEDTIEKNRPKFKLATQTKSIVRKYRQREQREKKRLDGKSELSEGELSSEEEEGLIKDDAKDTEVYVGGRWIRATKPNVVRKDLDLSSELDWVEMMPSSPNELQITFTVQTNIGKEVKSKINKVVKPTLAERSGSFTGEKISIKELDSAYDKKKRRSSSPRTAKSPLVIELTDDESSDENLSDGDKKSTRRRKRRRSSKQAGKRSRSRSRSPLKRPKGYSLSRSRSRSLSPYRSSSGERSRNSRSPRNLHRRHRRSRSRSLSPKGYERRRRRSHSRSPRRYRRSHSRSPSRRYRRSHSRSPSRRYRRSHSRSPSRRYRRSHSSSPPRRHKRSRSSSPSRRHSRSHSRTQSPNKETKEKENNIRKQTGQSHSRSKSPSSSKNQSQSAQAKESPANDTDFNSEDMDISSGDETPLIIDPKDTFLDLNDDADVSKKLEEAMARLKKLEDSPEKKVIKDSEKMGPKEKTELSEHQQKSKDLNVNVEKTEEMDKQLIEAVQRLQKMEESYSKRQDLLNNLRQSIIEADSEADVEVIELEPEEKDENSDDKKTDKGASTSSVHPKTSKPTSSTKPTTTTSVSKNPTTVPSTSSAPSKKTRWDSHAKKYPEPSNTNPAPVPHKPVPEIVHVQGLRIPSIVESQRTNPAIRPPPASRPPPANKSLTPEPTVQGRRIPSVLERPSCPSPQMPQGQRQRQLIQVPYNGPVRGVRPGTPMGPRQSQVVKPPFPHGPPPSQPPPATRPPATSVRPPAPSSRPPVSYVRLSAPVPVLRPPGSIVRPPAHVVRPPVSVVRPPAPMVRTPAPVVRPPPSAVRPTSSAVRPPHSVVIRPTSSVVRPPSSVVRPPPSAVRPPAPVQQPKPSHEIVWLIGSSVLCQAARYVAQGPVGLGLMLSQAELVWHGNDNLKWSEFGPLLTRLINQSSPPNVLLVHMDALELAKSSFQDLAHQAVESLMEFNRRNPKCRIIWSDVLPCCNYPGSIAKMTMEQVRINYNVMCSKLVLSLNGQTIKHSAIRPETTALFDADRMHLSDLGNNIFLNNLRRGLAFLLSEPTTKVYCASDDRTF